MKKPPKRSRKLTDIEGIDEAGAAKLKQHGIQTVEDLLKKAGTPKERAAISAGTGISKRDISDWVNRAELLMIEGIGTEYARLLKKAGVDSAPELAMQDPKRLHEKMVEVNQKRIVDRVPSQKEVARWIRQVLRAPRRRL